VKKAPLPKKVRLTLIVLAVVFVGLLAVRIYNSRRFHLEKQTRFMMDTYVTIYAVGPKKVTSRAIDLALDRMQEVDTKFNILNPKSPLYAFNRQGVPISDQEILDVVRLALEVSHDSGGAFDITISPLIELWGFYGDSPNLPQEQEIRACLNKIGYRHLNIEDGRLEKTKEEIGIDLGGIAKGYSVSQAAKVLRAEGATSALIDAGGDVYALGKKGRKFWNVGIRSPRGEDLLGYVEVEDLAVMGSGDYERFFIKDGKRFHHILDPKTGYPAEGLSGSTVIYPDPILADAWATALFVMGLEKGLETVKKIPGMEAIMVTHSGERLYSSGLKDAFKVIPKIK
jgi:thiamine biosynthesis lipoprotein